MIGEDAVTKWDTLREGDLRLHILSPTDCVRDRLAWFLFNNDFSALEQALAVAARHPIDLEAVGEWAEREGERSRYKVFEDRYKALDKDGTE